VRNLASNFDTSAFDGGASITDICLTQTSPAQQDSNLKLEC